ncbi:MAG: chemotaxis protein CheC [Deltaproteobacteria bacterium]|nr:chemotaxis protein CheC [Deltaproteobacteria bacterium]
MDPSKLTHVQLDALREVTHTGCGAAATALSQLIGGQPVDLQVVEAGVVAPGEVAPRLNGEAGEIWGVQLELRGGMEGTLLLAYNHQDARALTTLLAGEKALDAEGAFTDLGLSSLAELGNILASAYLTAVGTVTGLILLPSVPTVVHGTNQSLASSILREAEGEERLLLLETRLTAEGPAPLSGHLIIAARPKGIGTLLSALNL